MEVLATAARKEKERNWNQIVKEEVKPSLFVDDTILYTENPNDSVEKKTVRTLVLTLFLNKFSKVAGTKLIYTILSHLCTPTTNYQEERLRKQIPFKIA